MKHERRRPLALRTGFCIENSLMYLTAGEARGLAVVCTTTRATVDGWGPFYDQVAANVQTKGWIRCHHCLQIDPSVALVAYIPPFDLS